MRRNTNKILAWLLSAGIFMQSVPVYAAEEADFSGGPAVIQMDGGASVTVSSEFTDSGITSPEDEVSAEPLPTDNLSSEPQKDITVEDGTPDIVVEEIPEAGQQQTDSVVSGTQSPDFSSGTGSGEQGGSQPPIFTDNAGEPTDSGTVSFPGIYENGIIKIYNLAQLRAIGSGAAVTSMDMDEAAFGTGEAVTENGIQITYSPDGRYQIMNDIPLDAADLWSVPEDFRGTLTGGTADETSPLYNPETDSIYIYHNAQLLAILSENSQEIPVTSGDMFRDEFGQGLMLYPDGTPAGADEVLMECLTYSRDHSYILSGSFNWTGQQEMETAEDHTSLYENGAIKIYNYSQLEAIGSGSVLMTGDLDEGSFGTGEPVTDGGAEITYSLDGQYQLMNDIALDPEDLWTLPEDFQGTFLGENADETATLYDAASDTVYMYNNYQLLTASLETSAEEPIMSMDMIPENFGMGQFLYRDGTQAGESYEEAQDYLTYGKDHSYILSRNFTEEMPEFAFESLADDKHKYGRKYAGQIIWEENDKDYILIGNKTQLEAIGKESEDGDYYSVIGPAYDYHVIGDYFELKYCGDADLDWSEENNGGELLDINLDNALEDVTKRYWYGVKDDGEPSLSTMGDHITGKRYSPNENYIIFRDIDLKNEAWTPMNLSGDMEGRKNMVSSDSVTISNINVVHDSSAIDPTTTRGFGFFGSVSEQSNAANLGLSAGTTLIKNINLDGVTVHNQSSTAQEPSQSLIEGLLGLVGGLVGGLLDGITGILDFLLGWIPGLGFKLSFLDLFHDLFTVDETTQDVFAAGSFAGRITGDVRIENCHVTGASVSNVKGMTGGFAGYTEGETRYDDISGLTGDLVETLANLLNVIPGLGLGDLITILLKNGVDLGSLIPTGYSKPQIKNCSVSLTNGSIGNSDTEYNGGFIGVQIATETKDCIVRGLTSVQAKTGAGGFAGIARDAVVISALSDLGVNLYSFDIQARQTDCVVNGTNIKVSSSGQYAGGFNGVMTNSTSKKCGVESLATVSAREYAGGFTGRATIGYGTAIGDDYENDNTLLEAVSKLLTTLLSPENEDKLNTLLTISGLTPSELYDCAVTGTNWTVTASGDYAGGMIGQGDGAKISTTDGGSGSLLQGVSEVTAANYAGGIAGSVTTANPIGVLNDTLGVGSYLPFTVKNVTVEGSRLQVKAGADEAGKYASGGLGLAIGGTVDQVTVKDLASVSAGNYTGGLAGRSGTGGMVKEGGLDLLGLGVIKVNNLLSLMDGMQVQISDTTVEGTSDGAVITSTGDAEISDGEDILAGGFISEAEGVQIRSSSVSGLREVTAVEKKGKESYAGGFVGRSHTGGLAGLAQKGDDGSLKLPGILEIESLLDLIPYLLPSYRECRAFFVSNGEKPQVAARYAGGFFGFMQSGEVNNSGANPDTESFSDGSAASGDPYAVDGLEYVRGIDYAGGFAGKVESGAVASAGGLNLLNGIAGLNLKDILDVLNVYIPELTSAEVRSAESGLRVEASAPDSSAGGYIGYGSGVQIKDSDVTSLKHTPVTPPSDSLESSNGENYFNSEISSYAVKGGKYAGGYIGCADIDSAANVGEGLGLLGDAVNLEDVLSALDVATTKIENSTVSGMTGGYSVLANGRDDNGKIIGMAGGYAGRSSGTRIVNSDALNFAYVIGRENAGGYAGLLEPGNVASVLGGNTSILGVLDISGLLSVMQSFIPIVKGCQSTSIPCGGAVRADGYTDVDYSRGMAGGYVGYNHGGRIDGSGRECAVVRLRSVYGGEFAGGFTGLMESGAVADTGKISVLFSLINIDNILGLLQAVYPTETNTAVYGPLRNVDMNTWNSWVNAVGSGGVYGAQFPSEPVSTEEELKDLTVEYAYGYNVRAGRSSVGGSSDQAGCAGGYVGRMSGGVVTEAHAWDVRDVAGYESAGGFAGEMFTGGAANVGGVELAGIKVLTPNTLNILQTFVPVVRNSDVTGYQSGMYVKATGIPRGANGRVEKVGYAGGFVGHMVGGQIWGNWGSDEGNSVSTFSAFDPGQMEPSYKNRCVVNNLRRVDGTNAVGGFAGLIDPGSAADLDTASSGGLLNGLLQGLIGTPGDLLSLLNATISTVRAADVKAWDAYGIIINGVYSDGSANTAYAKAAGGFAGEINGAVIGEMDKPESGVRVEDIRSVTAGEHAGGFFGLADVSAVAEISGDGETSILGSLLKLGAVDVMDAFRTYIYDSSVSGTEKSGLEVHAHTWKKSGLDTEPVYTGNAGGFGGTLLNGSVKGSQVTNLREVEGLNYTGGFIGHLGKSGVVDLDKLGVLDKILGVSAGVLDVFGSHVEDSSVSGLAAGFTVKSRNAAEEKQEIAGGFAGYADLAKLDRNKAVNLKQVASEETAGGFAGQTSFAYLADISADSLLVKELANALNTILKALWVKDLENGDIIKIDLDSLEVDALYDGDLVHLNLLGLDISIALAKDKQLATVYIGDSKIEINCAQDGSVVGDIANEIQVSLIKANRTRIRECQVTGIPEGYDVYGGNAGNDSNGSGEKGYAGGFVGFNDEGLLERNQMYLADVIRGTKGITGPFTGSSSLESNWDFNTLSGIEGNGNQYRIYREADAAYEKLLGSGDTELQDSFKADTDWNIYTITHMAEGKVENFTDLKNAVMSNGSGKKALNAYMEDGAMAVLMDNTPTEPTEPGDEELPPDAQDPCTDTVQLRIQKFWKGDSEENRPEKIVLHITRSYKDSEGQVIQDTDFAQEVTLSKQDYQSEDTWEKILSGQPYTAYHVGENGEKYYYTYTVSEDALEGYETTISYSGEYHYTIKIVNKGHWFDSLLPDTGGMGTTWIYMVGVLLLGTAAAMEYRKRMRSRKQNNYK